MNWKDFSLKEKIYLIEFIGFSIINAALCSLVTKAFSEPLMDFGVFFILVLIFPLFALILSLSGAYITIKRKEYYSQLPFLMLTIMALDLIMVIAGIILTTIQP